MSSRGGNSHIGGGVQSIPAASRKMVQSLKEIVNCPEAEIYSMLKDCNMDPNEAVNRLLSQDPFHEVKSKRDKKKESRETIELKPRAASSFSSRGSRSASDRYSGYGGSTQNSFSESGGLHGKSASKKENGLNFHTNAPLVSSGRPSNNLTKRSSVPSENKVTTQVSPDGNWSSSQSVSGYQPASSGTLGQVSMADIVKMGRPPNKSSSSVNSSHHINQHHVWTSLAGGLDQTIHSSKDPAPKLSDPEPGVCMGQHVPVDDDWPVDEQPPTASVPSMLESTAPDLHVDTPNFSTSSLNQHHLSQADKASSWFAEDSSIENINMSRPESASSRKIQDDNASSTAHFDDELHSDVGSFQLQRHAFAHQEAEEVVPQLSEVATNMQHLSVHEDQGLQHEEEHPSVIIPDHLQVQTAECLHLSFGSFGPGNTDAFPSSYSSGPSKSSLNESSADPDAPFVGHSDARSGDYHRDELQRISSDGNISHEHCADAGNYESPSVSQHEALNKEIGDVSRDSQYTFPSVTSNYNYESSQLLNAALPHHPQFSSQLHNLPPFSTIMQQAHTNTLPSSLHASNVQPSRDSEHPYSPFPLTQSMPAKYGNQLASISGSVMSMPEQGQATTTQNLPGNNSTAATGPALPQHVAVHPYSQPTLPLGPFANMIGYPFLPQSYTYLPSAFQQPFAGNSAYHQSLAAALLPQYKNSVSVSSLPPQSAATIASGYGGFGNSTTIPSNFPINQPSAQGGPTTIGYDDLLGSQYKDNNNLLISLQQLGQNENSAMWLHGLSSRTAVPPNTFYSFQGQQQQQPGGLSQQQQPSQGGYGYPNHYHSQGNMSTEHQPQNPRDLLAGGPQGQGSQQPSSNPNQQPMWQNGY
ncbi:uncharacterized protein LOC124936905 isoform X2 [Impatiens glandulifera]|uniref:uncharacterized protein LOC124936905 isoform X2 n=1 Tax=Impatiens glandulifera TaxID=253017 RepID=UPI001FB0D8D9|nr:uncharacterized protein LOC124936905 isoform X2 [Impatiens glandulifera]